VISATFIMRNPCARALRGTPCWRRDVTDRLAERRSRAGRRPVIQRRRPICRNRSAAVQLLLRPGGSGARKSNSVSVSLGYARVLLLTLTGRLRAAAEVEDEACDSRCMRRVNVAC